MEDNKLVKFNIKFIEKTKFFIGIIPIGKRKYPVVESIFIDSKEYTIEESEKVINVLLDDYNNSMNALIDENRKLKKLPQINSFLRIKNYDKVDNHHTNLLCGDMFVEKVLFSKKHERNCLKNFIIECGYALDVNMLNMCDIDLVWEYTKEKLWKYHRIDYCVKMLVNNNDKSITRNK